MFYGMYMCACFMACTCVHVLGEETPLYKDTELREKFIQDSLPEDRPKKGTDRFTVLLDFCQNVEIILQTVNENEYDAATTFLKPPNNLFKKAVIFPENCMVLGMFGDKRTSLIQTRVGENAGKFIEKAHKRFPRAVYFIGVGVCYAFNKDKYKLGDVIVSNKICTFFDSAMHGELTQDRGERISVIDDLQDTFCRAQKLKSKFKVCEGRFSKAYEGPIVSFPLLIKDAVFRDQILKAVPGAIAGEMEGAQLLKFVQTNRIKGIIIIKGVVDYGDKNKKNDWQFIAASAALHYTECKLFNKDSELDEGEVLIIIHKSGQEV